MMISMEKNSVRKVEWFLVFLGGYRKIKNYKHISDNQFFQIPKNDSHKFSDGPLTVGLMDGETELSIDQVTSQSEAAAEETKLSTDNINGQRCMTTCSVDIPVEHLETNGRQLDHTEITRNDLICASDVSDLSSDAVKDGLSKFSQFSPDITVAGHSKKKLLVLDVNGLLADLNGDTRQTWEQNSDFWSKGKKGVMFTRGHFVTILTMIQDIDGNKIQIFGLKGKKFTRGLFVTIFNGDTRHRWEQNSDFWSKGKTVHKRPFCDDFLQFCFDRFHVGVWSSKVKRNLDEVIEILMGESASKLLFCWNRSHCTKTGFGTVEKPDKPMMLKELRKLWEKAEPSLPWENGEFNESNTLLLDDFPYKALVNPKHTGIFPFSYWYDDTEDSSLGPGGDLRVYLEGLAMADNVQEYVKANPFGQRPIREANPSWGYYRKVIKRFEESQNAS